MKRILAATLIALGIFMFVPVSVKGSIYVVTKDMSTIPMPMTQVRIYDASEFAKAIETKKLDYLKNCSSLPSPDYMRELERRALREGTETAMQFMDYRDKIEACSTASFLSADAYLTPIKTVTTDKKGEFELSTSRLKNIVVVAEGKRILADGEESYTWLNKFSPSLVKFSGTVELNNQSEISSTTFADLQI